MQRSTVFLLVVALASAGVSAGLWMELHAERALNAELGERLKTALAAPIAPQPAVNPRVEAPSGVAPAATAHSPIPPPAEPAAAKSPQFAREDWQARQRQLLSDPRYREAFREQERLRLATRRENFIRLLGFTPEQADAVIDLSIERQMNWPAGIPRGDGEGDERAYQARLRDLLGDEKSAQLQGYMESRQTRMQVDQFRTQLAGADALRDDQVEPLIAALHTERAQMQQDLQEFAGTLSQEDDSMGARRKYSDRETELLKDTYARMRSSAASILSSSQLQKLDAMLKRDLERREAQQRMWGIQSKFEQPSVVEIPPR